MGQLNSFVTLPVSHHTNPFSLNSLPCGEGQGGVCPFCCPPRSRTSLLGTKIRCNTDIRVDTACIRTRNLSRRRPLLPFHRKDVPRSVLRSPHSKTSFTLGTPKGVGAKKRAKVLLFFELTKLFTQKNKKKCIYMISQAF